MAYADLSQIEVHQIVEYKDNQEFLVQKKYSTLAKILMPISVSGAAASIQEQVGEATAHGTATPTRADDSPIDGISGDKRWVFPYRIDAGTLIDNQDTLRMTFDPTGKYNESLAMAMARKTDAYGYSKFVGTNYNGKTGTSAVTFPSSQTIDACGVVGGTGIAGTQTGLNSEKIKKITRVLQLAYALAPNAKVHGIIGPWQQEDMYNDIEYISSDYTGNRVLEANEMKPFGGVTKFHIDANLPTTTENGVTVRQCLFFVEGGFEMAKWGQFLTAVEQVIGKRMNVQIYQEMNIDFTRTQEKMCIVVNCLESE